MTEPDERPPVRRWFPRRADLVLIRVHLDAQVGVPPGSVKLDDGRIVPEGHDE